MGGPLTCSMAHALYPTTSAALERDCPGAVQSACDKISQASKLTAHHDPSTSKPPTPADTVPVGSRCAVSVSPTANMFPSTLHLRQLPSRSCIPLAHGRRCAPTNTTGRCLALRACAQPTVTHARGEAFRLILSFGGASTCALTVGFPEWIVRCGWGRAVRGPCAWHSASSQSILPACSQPRCCRGLDNRRNAAHAISGMSGTGDRDRTNTWSISPCTEIPSVLSICAACFVHAWLVEYSLL